MIQMTDEQKQKLMQEYSVYSTDDKGNSKLIIPNLGELIYNELGYHFLTTYDNKQIYCYNGGCYEQKGEPIIKDHVEQFLQDETKEYYKNETVGYIRDKNYHDREIFNSQPYMLNLQNGVLDIKHNKFLEHSPDYYFLTTIPVAYKKNAKIKKIKQFLKQILRPDDIKRIQEIFGYCLYREYHIQKAFMFLGDGANGKSTVLNLLKTMIGIHNVSSVSLQELCDNRFAAANLYNKLANIYPDLPDKTLTKTGMFKILTGGDNISAEQKFKDHFNFINYAKLIFSANKLPEVKDDTNAFFRRWEFLNFPYTFFGDKCDPKILSKLTTDQELSGLLNWSIIGLRRLLKNGCFTNSSTVDEMREKYQRLSSPIAAFVMDCVEISPGFYIFKDDLYACFVQYCANNGLPVVAKQTFSTKIHEYVRVTEYRPPKQNNRETRERAWLGIDFADMSSMSNMANLSSYLYRREGSDSYDIKIDKTLDTLDTMDNKESDSDD